MNFLETLRQHRPLLLACETNGWLHMTGKAHPDFLRQHAGLGVNYQYKEWHKALDPSRRDRLGWLKDKMGNHSCSVCRKWPNDPADFLTKFDQEPECDLIGLLQAAHAMASGIEKNLPKETSQYLVQGATRMGLVTPFGHPVRNLLNEPPAASARRVGMTS